MTRPKKPRAKSEIEMLAVWLRSNGNREFRAYHGGKKFYASLDTGDRQVWKLANTLETAIRAVLNEVTE